MDMNIVTELRNAGIRLTIEDGKIKATGDKAALARWLPLIRERRDEIFEALGGGAGEAAPLTPDEEMTIRRWLSAIGEHDEMTIGGVIQQCRGDAAARDYFLKRAAEELPGGEMTRRR
jgi:hypothetical protein